METIFRNFDFRFKTIAARKLNYIPCRIVNKKKFETVNSFKVAVCVTNPRFSADSLIRPGGTGSFL